MELLEEELKITKIDDGKRPQFGNRLLESGNDVFLHNAWDNIQWDKEQEEDACRKISEQSKFKIPDQEYRKIEKDSNIHWDMFYQTHQNKFFKDRNWIFTEFPELQETEDGIKYVFEIGCGVGNSVFPILNHNPSLHVYCCDFSENAIAILKNNVEDARCNAFVCDMTDYSCQLPFGNNSIDFVLMIYVLSSIDPDKMNIVVKRIYECLKPGGMILFRDYGRYDMSQLRFKQGSYISENFYLRGEKTMVYFFTSDEIRKMFENMGFEEVQNKYDKRLQVNRKKLLKMYRVWVQGKYRKPINK